MLDSHVANLNRPISRLVQGTQIPVMNLDREREAFQLLDEVFDLGCNAFDTARTYQGGQSEQVFGRWLQTRGNRDQVVIIGKGGHPRDGRSRITPADIEDDLTESLRQMDVDCIDLYFLHRDDPSVPVSVIVDCLSEHRKLGRIEAYGASNWTVERLAEANSYAETTDGTGFIASSPHFSLAVPVVPPWPDTVSIAGPDHQIARDWYAASSFPVFAWSSLSHGFFTGKFNRRNLDQFVDPWDRTVVEAFCTEENFQRFDRACEMAESRGLTVPQVAVAYALSSPMNIFPLVGCWSGAEYSELAAAAAVQLSDVELRWLEHG